MKNDQIKIFKTHDLEIIKECIVKFDNSSPRTISSRVCSIEEFAVKLRNNAENYCLTINNNINGFISFYANNKKQAYLSVIAVDENVNNMGFGTKLMNVAFSEIEKKKIQFFMLEVDNGNKNAVNFYEKLGFKYVENASENSMFYRKELVCLNG